MSVVLGMSLGDHWNCHRDSSNNSSFPVQLKSRASYPLRLLWCTCRRARGAARTSWSICLHSEAIAFSLSLSLCICLSRLTTVLLAFASIKSGRAAVEATQSGSCSPGQPDRPGAQHAFIHTVWFSFPVSVAVELLKRIAATTTAAKIATKNNYDPLLTPSTPFHGTLPKRCNLWHI